MPRVTGLGEDGGVEGEGDGWRAWREAVEYRGWNG